MKFLLFLDGRLGCKRQKTTERNPHRYCAGFEKKMRQMNSSLTELGFRSSILSFRSFSIIYISRQLEFRLVNSRDHLCIQHFFQHGGEVELYLKK